MWDKVQTTSFRTAVYVTLQHFVRVRRKPIGCRCSYVTASLRCCFVLDGRGLSISEPR